MTDEDDFRLRALSAELRDRLMSDHPFYSWRPYPKQLSGMMSPARIRGIIGANRTGKSDTLHKIATEHFIGWSPCITRATGQLVTYRRPRHVWVSALDANVSRDVSEDKVRHFMPPDAMKHVEWRAADKMWRDTYDGSTLGFKSADSGRDKYQGTSRNLIVMDEEHPEDIFNECYARTIDCSGLIVMGFTAMKGHKWMHKLLFNSPGQDIFIVTLGLVDNPYIPRPELELAKQRYTGDEYRIRVLGEFILRIGSPFFPREDVEAQLSFCEAAELQNRVWKGRLVTSAGGLVKSVADADGKLKIFAAPRRDRFYSVGGDVSGGSALGDFTSLQVLDATDFKLVASWHGHIDPSLAGAEMVKLGKYYNNAVLVPETNQHGNATLSIIERQGYGNIFRREQADRISEEGKIMSTLGWYTDRRTKPLCLNHLKDHLREHSITIPDRDTVEELRLFGYLTEEAPSGSFGLGAVSGNDDRVMSLALSIQGAYQIGSPPGAVPSLNRDIGDVFMDDAQGRAGPDSAVFDFSEQSPSEWDEDFD